MIELELPWPPSINHYYRYLNRRVVISGKGRDFRNDVFDIIAEMDIKPITGPVGISIQIAPPDKRRRDIDNIQKPLLDALEHAEKVFENDSQIVSLMIKKKKPEPPNGRVAVQVWEVSLDALA